MKIRDKVNSLPSINKKMFEDALRGSSSRPAVSLLDNGASLSFVDLDQSKRYCPAQSLPDTICHLDDNIRAETLEIIDLGAAARDCRGGRAKK